MLPNGYSDKIHHSMTHNPWFYRAFFFFFFFWPVKDKEIIRRACFGLLFSCLCRHILFRYTWVFYIQEYSHYVYHKYYDCIITRLLNNLADFECLFTHTHNKKKPGQANAICIGDLNLFWFLLTVFNFSKQAKLVGSSVHFVFGLLAGVLQ